MSTAVAPQPIAGVSPSQERVIDVIYPSIASVGSGRLVGRIMNSAAARVSGVKLSNLIFGLPLAPLGMTAYLLQAVFGRRYVVTNRSIRTQSAMGRKLAEVPLQDVAEVAVDVLPGQEFHHAADLVLFNAKQDPVLRMSGIGRPERVRRIILDARDARQYAEESLAVISKRG